VRRARKSIANFKLRAGMPVGVRVTLRGERMYEMLDRLQSIAIPRIRDFRGLNPRSFDGRGNYSLGVREQIIFPEVDYDSIDQVRGLDVTITTTANSDEEGFELLRLIGMPFRTDGRSQGVTATQEERGPEAPEGEAAVIEDPAPEEPAAEEPAVETPAAETPSTETPSAQQSASEKQTDEQEG